MRHELKCWPEFFMDVWDRRKTFEIRENDRNFKVNDELYIREWDPQTEQYTGAWCTRKVLYITDFPSGLRSGYVCMSLG